MVYGWRIGGCFFLALTFTCGATPTKLQEHTSKGMAMMIEGPSEKRSDPLSMLQEGEIDSETLPIRHFTGNHKEDQVEKSESATSNSLTPQTKELYLTFDDGPVRGTGNVLNVLKGEGVPATMFCVGRHATLRPDLFRRELAMPNLLIANHTYSHANGHYSRFYSDTFELMSDVEHAQIVLGGRKYLRLAGRNVWRLPEVSRNDRAIMALRGTRELSRYDTLSKEGYFIYGWDVEWHFDHRSGRPIESPEALAARIDTLYRHGRPARQGKVVLLAHDFMFRNRYTAGELRRFIRLMKERGWRFKTLRHYSRLTPEPLYVAKYYGKDRRTFVASSTTKNVPFSRNRGGRTSSPRMTHIAIGSARHPAPGFSSATSDGLHQPAPRPARSPEALLTDAVQRYDAIKVDRLVRQGAPINRVDEFGRTALNAAVRANSLVLVKKLLAYGADPSQKDGSGITPLQTAQRFKRQAIEKYLIQYALDHGKKKMIASSTPMGGAPAAASTTTAANPLQMLRQP